MIENVEVNGISYELDKNNLTAKVIGSYIAVEDLYIPRSINFNSQNYIITSIADKLKSACKIKSISFDNDSLLGAPFLIQIFKVFHYLPVLKNSQKTGVATPKNYVASQYPQKTRILSILTRR